MFTLYFSHHVLDLGENLQSSESSRMYDSTTTQYHDQQTCPRAQSYTQSTTTHARAGALVLLPSCLDESISRVGPGQYPQYTRAPFGEEAVGSSQHMHHRAPQAQPMSPQQHPTRDESLAWERSHGVRDHGNGVTVNVDTGSGGARRQSTRRGSGRSHAADPDADAGNDSGGAQPKIVKCQVPVLEEMVQAIVSDDDHEEETLQSDAETAKKAMINETYTLLSIVTTGKAQRFIQDTDAPLHDESVIAVRQAHDRER